MTQLERVVGALNHVRSRLPDAQVHVSVMRALCGTGYSLCVTDSDGVLDRAIMEAHGWRFDGDTSDYNFTVEGEAEF